jgi:hypothetical protein
LMPCADAGIAKLSSGRGGCGVDCHAESVSKVAEAVNMRLAF